MDARSPDEGRRGRVRSWPSEDGRTPMAVAVRLPLCPPPVLPLVRVRPAPARCCDPGRCLFQPRMIRYVRWMRGELDAAGEDAHEAASSAFRPRRGYDELDRVSGVFGPRLLARWALVLVDVERAEAAGCRTDDEVSRFLCPFGIGDDDAGLPVQGRGAARMTAGESQ